MLAGLICFPSKADLPNTRLLKVNICTLRSHGGTLQEQG